MKNNNVLNFNTLLNRGIDVNSPIFKTCLESFNSFDDGTYKFACIFFDFDDDVPRQVQSMSGYDIFEVLREAYHGDYGDQFFIIIRDLSGLHFLFF